MGFGCSASAISTSSNLTNKKAQNKLVLLTPNISCSAKLPIYLVIGSAFFGAKNIFVILGLYLLGILILVLQAVFFNKLNPTQETFILEFPKLRVPRLKSVVFNCLKTAVNFLLKVGSTILVFSFVIWFLSHFSLNLHFTYDISQSILKNISMLISPIFAPLGLNSWGVVACLVSGLVAKEMVLSSICLLNGVGIESLQLSLSNGAVSFNTHTAIIFLIFCLIYTPCMSTYAVQKSISGRRVALTSMILQFATAYIVCMLFSTLIHLLKFSATFAVLIILAVISISIYCFKKKSKICNGNCTNCSSCKFN